MEGLLSTRRREISDWRLPKDDKSITLHYMYLFKVQALAATLCSSSSGFRFVVLRSDLTMVSCFDLQKFFFIKIILVFEMEKYFHVEIMHPLFGSG